MRFLKEIEVRIKLLFGMVALSYFVANIFGTIIIHTNDFIDDSERTHFNGFEGMPNTNSWTQPYSEDNIKVEQIGSGIIMTTYEMNGGIEGHRSWYPKGGDRGYTKITRDDGLDFVNIGFTRSSGIPELSMPGNGHLLFELYSNGILVDSGYVGHIQNPQYLGFSGGGFDEIRIRDGEVQVTSSMLDGTRNALAIDSIELSIIPEPSTLFLLGMGGIFCRKRQFNNKKDAVS